MKRLWVIVLLALGCQRPPPDGKIHITYWEKWSGREADAMQQVVDQFNRSQDRIHVEFLSTSAVDRKTLVATAGGDPPDVAGLWVPNIYSFADNNALTPLDDFIRAEGYSLEAWAARYVPVYMQMVEYKGRYYGLPATPATTALHWNKRMFREAGLDPERPPQTMEELAEYAKKLTKIDDNGNITQVGFIPDFSWSHLGLYVAMMGGYWYSDDGTRITFTSDSVVNALKWEQQFYCDYNTEDVLRFTSAFGGYMSPDNGFYAGKVAMMVEGEWQPGVNFIQKYKPELYYGVAPFPPPQANPERKNTNLVSGTVAMIPSGVKDKAAAWKLMAWMMSPEIVAEETEVSEAIHAAAHPGKVRAAGEGGSEAARTEEAAE